MPNHDLYLAARDDIGNQQLIVVGTYDFRSLNGSWDYYLASRDLAGNSTLAQAEASYTVTQEPPIFTNSSTLSAVQQSMNTLTLTATDANSDSVTFNTFGDWPQWLTLTDGVVTAKPTAGTPAGEYYVTAQANDGHSLTDQELTVTVEAFDGFAVPIHSGRIIENSVTVVYKDPDETLDYWLDFTNRLKQDEIESIDAVTIAPPGELLEASRHVNALTVTDSDGSTYAPNKVVSLWLTGGTLGRSYLINVGITTTAGRTYDTDIWVRCMNDVDAR